jgi:PPOX class probable F420-dependent enzyme
MPDWAFFDDERYLSLETYRANGTAVRTPVWFAAGPGSDIAKLYVYTTADSGKVKRLRRNGIVRIAACDMRGKITGPWIDAFAELVTGAESETGMRLLDRKYFPWKQLLNLGALLRHRERVVFAIRDRAPATE